MASLTLQEANLLLGNGRTKEALEVAKELYKTSPKNPQVLTFLGRAYALRTRALAWDGLWNEAVTLGQSVVSRYPATAEALNPVLYELEVMGKGFERLLGRLLDAQEPEKSRLLEILSANLTDPRLVAESPVLPQDYPLKREAIAVWTAFEAVTSGPAAQGVFGLLDAVPRSSIFAPWKLAIRAITAVYQQDFQTAKKNIAAIPESSRVHALVPILADMAGTPHQSLGVAEKSLQKATGSLRQRFGSILGQLEKAVKAGNPEAISRALDEIHALLPALPNAARPVILATLLSNLDENEVEPELLEKSLFSGKLRGELHRFLALEGEGGAPFFSVVFWGKYLDFAYARKLFSEQSLETALILLRINHLLLQDELYGDAAAGLDEPTRRLLASGNPALFDREKVLERVLAIRPFSEAFSSLLDIYLEREEEEQALLVAEQWCQRSPNDARPWRYRTGVMAMRGQSDLSMKLIDEAMEKNPFEPSFRELRFFGFLERLGGLIRKGAPGVTETLAECRRQAGAISDQAHLFISALEWVLAQRVKGRQKKGDVKATERFRSECGNDHLARILAMTAEQWAGSTLTRPDWKDGEALDGYIRALRICHSLHAHPRVPVEFLVDLEKSLPTTSTRQLLAIVRTSQVPDHGDFPRLIHAAILEGLTRRDETCGIFLAMAVSTTPSRRKSSVKALLNLKRVMGFLLETHPQAEGTEGFRYLVEGLRNRIGFDADRIPSPSEIERCVAAEIKKLELFLNVPKARKRKGSPENNEFF